MNAMSPNAASVTLGTLAKRPLWVAWQTQEREPGKEPSKVPYSPAGTLAKSDDPSTWGTREAAQRRAATLPKPFGLGGVGLELAALDDRHRIGGIDLDTCLSPDGVIEPWAAEVLHRFGTYAEVSPSHTGIKLFFVYDAANLPTLRNAMGTDHGKLFKRRTGTNHPPAIELHVSRRFFAVTDERYGDAQHHLRHVPLADLLWIVHEAGPAFVAAENSGRRRGNGDRSAAAFRLACQMKRDGLSFDGWVAALDNDPDTRSWKAEKGDQRQLSRTWERASGEGKPRLLYAPYDPDESLARLRDTLAEAGGLYDRGVPVRLAYDQMQRGMVAQPLTPDLVVIAAHQVCRPYEIRQKQDGTSVEVNARVPKALATAYLDWRGEWNLPPLHGIAAAPLLHADGSIHAAEGYDQATGMWCEAVPDLAPLLPAMPTWQDAERALLTVRRTFATFCFADAETVEDAERGVAVVDVSRPPGRDESGFLAALLTAVCRPSLHLAPGILLRAAPMSGAGAGKGLLARCLCIIAFGREPHAVTAGSNAEELEKRIAAELIEGSPALFLDNLNNTAFKSDLLASAITERPARVRVLGKSQMVPLCASALVVLTGNGLTVSEDLARRFVAVELDPRTEDPEARPFKGDIRAEVRERRAELLAACLTIWRWGRQDTGIKPGLALGSFGQWCAWVRDPLLALGCQDPAERVSEAKARDTRRQAVADLFSVWWERHHDMPVAVRDLHDDVRAVADPQGRGRQFLAASLDKLTGTRMAGFMLTRQAPAGQWGAATYALQNLAAAEKHRGHRGHRTPDGGAADPMPPMPPMPSDPQPEWADEVVL